MVAYAHDFSIQETEAEQSPLVQGQLGLLIEHQDSQRYITELTGLLSQKLLREYLVRNNIFILLNGFFLNLYTMFSLF